MRGAVSHAAGQRHAGMLDGRENDAY
jgi:hypothetical protein